MSIQAYKTKLAQIVKSSFQDLESNRWTETLDLIDQDVLTDAFSQIDQVKQIYWSDIQSRTCKRMARVEKKKQIPSLDFAFKANSDFLAFRIPCHPHEIENIMFNIISITVENQGQSHVRGKIRNEEDQLIDIVQFVYVFLPQIGYIIEFQVGHPFAFYTFRLDTHLRNLRKEGVDTSHMIDLWSTKDGEDWQACFYIQVRNRILNPEPGQDVWRLYTERYADKTIDKDLWEILNQICPLD